MPNSEIESLCGLTVMAHGGKCGVNPSLWGRIGPWAVNLVIMTRNAALAKGKLRDGGGIHGMGLSKQLSEGRVFPRCLLEAMTKSEVLFYSIHFTPVHEPVVRKCRLDRTLAAALLATYHT